MATPIEKTKQDTMIPILRPRISAVGPEINAPKKVPAERMELSHGAFRVSLKVESSQERDSHYERLVACCERQNAVCIWFRAKGDQPILHFLDTANHAGIVTVEIV